MAWYRSNIKQSGGGTQFADLMALASGSTAFDLDDATLHTEATSIPQYMFNSNTKVRDISLTNVTDVGMYSFSNASNVRNINLPACTHIGESAFYTCRRSSSVASGSTINLPEVLTIDANAFYEFGFYDSTLEIDLTKCTTLGQGAFRAVNASYGMVAKEVNLPAVQTIGNQAFQRATLTDLKIGANCTSLGQNIFLTATITNLYCEATTPPTIGSNNLGSPTLSHIYVPANSVATYKSANGWSAFESIIEAIPT